jgi:hypothetical protein
MNADWRNDAACKDQAPYFDAHIDGETTEDMKYRQQAAIVTCGRCPVFEQCKADTDPLLDGGTIRAGKVLPRPKLPQAPHAGAQPLPREHGTTRGWRQHFTRNDMPACEKCAKARREYDRKYELQKQSRRKNAA